MSGLPTAWETLRRSVNGESGLIGTPGIRDPDGVCESFDGKGYTGRGTCHSDGHYLCVECSELSPDAPRFHEHGRAGRADRLRLFWARTGLTALLALIVGCNTPVPCPDLAPASSALAIPILVSVMASAWFVRRYRRSRLEWLQAVEAWNRYKSRCR